MGVFIRKRTSTTCNFHIILVITLLILFIPGISCGATLCSYQGSDITAQNLGLRMWDVSGPQPFNAGNSVNVKYIIVAEKPVTLGPKGVFVAGKDPDGKSFSFGSNYQGKSLSAGETLSITSSYSLNREGTWVLWPSYEVAVLTPGMKTGSGFVEGPSLWHSCSVTIKPVAQKCQEGCTCLPGNTGIKMGYRYCGGTQAICGYGLNGMPLYCFAEAEVQQVQECTAGCTCLSPGDVTGRPGFVPCDGQQIACAYDRQNNPMYCYQPVQAPVPVTSPAVVPTTAQPCSSDCECLTIYEAKESGYREFCGGKRIQCGEDNEQHPRWCYKISQCQNGCQCHQPDEAGAQGLHLCDGKMTGCGFDENNRPRFCYEAPSERDSDQDGIPDMVENELLERFSPYYKFTKTEKYLPIDAIWYIRHSELKYEADEQSANAIGNAILKDNPEQILNGIGYQINIGGEATQIQNYSDIVYFPRKTGFALNIIGDDARKGHLPGDPYPTDMSVTEMWEEISARGNVGLYGHVVPYGRYYKIEYYQLFGYSDTEQFEKAGEYGDHEADWSIVQVIYDPETDSLQRVLHHAHGKEMSFDMRLANDFGEFFDGGAIKQYRGPNFETGLIDIAKNEGYDHWFCKDAEKRSPKGRWWAQNNLIQLYISSPPDSGRMSYLPQNTYSHPVVYIERGAHEFWPSEHWKFIEWVGAKNAECEWYPPTHRGDYVSYLTHDIPNLGEVEYPKDEDSAIIMRYNGRWGAYASYMSDPPPGPVIHREWFWPVDSALRKIAYDDTFEDGSSISHHWPAVVDLLITFRIHQWDGLAVGNVVNPSDGIDEIVFADRENDKIKVINPIGQFIEEYSINFDEGDAITLGDVDGDGTDEIIIGDHNNENLKIFSNGIETQSIPVFDKNFKQFDRLASGNVMGDTREEILYADDEMKEIFVYDNSGTILSRFIPKNEFNTGDGLISGDTDGDGADEIIHGDADGKTITVYAFDGTPLVSFQVSDGIYLKHDGLASGDMNGDGKDEIIHACRDSNRITVYSPTGEVIARFYCAFAEGAGIVTGKFRKGNKEEIVVINLENNLKIFSLFDRPPLDVTDLLTRPVGEINANPTSSPVAGNYFPVSSSAFMILFAIYLKFRKK